MQIEQILNIVAALCLALGSQGVFVESFNWVWFVITLIVGLGVFPYASSLPAYMGALLVAVFATLSLSPHGVEFIHDVKVWGWILSVAGAAYAAFEIAKGVDIWEEGIAVKRPNRLLILLGIAAVIAGGIFSFGAGVLTPVVVVMLISLMSLEKEIYFPYITAKIMLPYVLVGPWVYRLGEWLKELFAIGQ